MEELNDYNDLKQIATEVCDRLQVNLKTNSNNDTEIFIRIGITIHSFRHTRHGDYYDRWHIGTRYNREELKSRLKELVQKYNI
jgi:hypothetical protein